MLFNYTKPGPGVAPDEPRKTGLPRIWEMISRDFKSFWLAGALNVLLTLPFAFAVGYACATHSLLFALLAGVLGGLIAAPGFLGLADTLLRSLRDEGKCILLTGQHFETISSLIDDVIVLDHGRLLFEGSAKMFQGQWAAKASEQADLRSAFEHIINVKGSACPASGKEDLL